MAKKSRLIAICAILTAFSVIFLYISAVVPTGQIGFVAVASLFGIAAVIETGIKGGAFVFAGSAVLSFIIVPDKLAALLYVLFFGYYPVMKSLAEKMKNRLSEWCVKLLVFNAALTVILLAFSEIIYSFINFNKSVLTIYVLFNICFVIFDFGVSKAIGFYINKISKRIR